MASIQEKRDALIRELNKSYGKGTIGKGSDLPPVEFIKSGIPKLDWALNGGLARGRVVELWGAYSGGKSTIAGIYIGAEQRYQATQDDPKWVGIFDRERTLNEEWFTKLGVDMDALDVIRDGYPDSRGNPVYHTAEDVVNMTIKMAESGAYSFIVWDSLAALTPRAKLEGKKDFADQKAPGGLAALLSETLPHICQVMATNNCTLLIINQLREKIGVLFGDTASRLGGNALDHYASQVARVYRGDYYETDVKDPETGTSIGKMRIGNDSRIKVTKSKVGPPFREATIPLFYDRGVDLPQMIADLSKELRVVDVAGRWISHPAFLSANPETGELLYGEPLDDKGRCGSMADYVMALTLYPDLLDTIRQECIEVLERV